MHVNQYFFNIVITETFWNIPLHTILLVFEYFVFIFPFQLSSAHKIKMYKQVFNCSALEDYLEILSKIREKLILNKQDQYSIYIIITVIITFFLICYYLLLFLYRKKIFPTWAEIFIVNFYNLFFFRYFSSLFIDSLIFKFYEIKQNEDYYINQLLSYVILLILYCYIASLFFFINNFAIYYQISNKQITKIKIKYPFDHNSFIYDTFILLIKIASSLDSNKSFFKDKVVSSFNLYCNILILILSLGMLISICYEKIFIKIKLTNVFINEELNWIKKFFRILSFSIVFIRLTLSYGNGSFIEYLVIIMCLLISLCLTFFAWLFIEKPNMIQKSKNYISEVAEYLLTQNLPNELKQINNFRHMQLVSYLETEHFVHCKNPEKCKACSTINNNDNGYNKIYFIYKTQLSKKRQLTYVDYLIKYFRSKINSKIFNFYKYYFMLIGDNKLKTPSIIKNTLKFYMSYCFVREARNTHLFLQDFINLFEFKKKLKELLIEFKEFIEVNITLKSSRTILKLSKVLQKLKNKLILLIQRLDVPSSSNIKGDDTEKEDKKSQNRKNIQSACKYNVIISRYILELLENTSMDKLNLLNIDLLEDYLNYHFFHDKIIVLTTSLENSDKNTFQTIAITGLPEQKNKTFEDYFPDHLKDEGTKRLLHAVQNVNNNNNKFEFIVNVEKYISYMIFQFELGKTLLDNQVLIYGFYQLKYDKVILLDFGNSNNEYQKIKDLNQCKVIGYSRLVSKLLVLIPQEIEIITKQLNKKIYLRHFFKTIATKDRFVYDQLQCDLNYNYLKEKLNPLFEEIKTNYDKTLEENEKYESRMNKINETFMKREGTNIKLIFKKIFEVSPNQMLYKINFMTKNSKIFSTKDSQSLYNENEDKDTDQEDYIVRKEMNTLTISNTSSTEKSLTEKNSTKSGNGIKAKGGISRANELVKTEISNLSEISNSVMILNIILIMICFIFLVIQINQTEQMKTVNDLYSRFKILRCDFASIAANIFSQMCLASNPEDTTCVNELKEYTEQYQKRIGFTDYSIFDYLTFENMFKIDNLKDSYNNIQNIIYQNKYNDLYSVFEREVNIITFEKKPDNSLVQHNNIKSFSETFTIFINTLYILSTTKENGKSFREIPVYFATLDNQTIFFNEHTNLNFSSIQLDVYIIITNFINFTISYNKGETIILQKFKELKKTNSLLLWSYMLLLGFFNLLVTLINFINLEIARRIFKKIICSIIFRLKNWDYKEYLNKKVDNLIILANLYVKKPTMIIKNLDKLKLSAQKAKAKKINQNKIIKSKQGNKILDSDSSEEQLFIQSTKNSSFQMVYFTKNVVFPLFLKTFIFAAFYFIVILLCDFFLMITFQEVFNYQEYVSNQMNFEFFLYNDVSFVLLNRLLNITEVNFDNLLDKEPESDGMVNLYFRESMTLYSNLKQLLKKTNYHPLESYISMECSKLYNDLKNEAFTEFHKKNNLTEPDKMYSLQQKVCEDLHFYKEKDSHFIFIEYLVVLANVHNKYPIKTYEDEYLLWKDDDISKAYMYIYFFIRPVRKYISQKILSVEIKGKFQSYLNFVWIYLILNIFMESVLCLLTKKYIVSEIEVNKEYLLIFERCISC